MKITKTGKFEKALVRILNVFDGWKLEWVGPKNLPYDATGYTPKGKKCVVEMKFRTKYYETKMLEKKKYDALMALPEDVVKMYFVSDPKGSYWFWLDKIKELEVLSKNCPSTTFWNKSKVSKEVYLLNEKDASIVEYATPDKKGVWDDYFKKNKNK
jgi:hypothetical protein|tara:strand:+ start:157 stop:624 length:468 start_codon:yes stop_codon:yes gene_type:complete